MPWVAPLETIDATHRFDIYRAVDKGEEEPMANKAQAQAQVVPCGTIEEKQALLKKVAAWKEQQRKLQAAKERKARKQIIGYQLDAYENQKRRRA